MQNNVHIYINMKYEFQVFLKCVNMLYTKWWVAISGREGGERVGTWERRYGGSPL